MKIKLGNSDKKIYTQEEVENLLDRFMVSTKEASMKSGLLMAKDNIENIFLKIQTVIQDDTMEDKAKFDYIIKVIVAQLDEIKFMMPE